MTQLNIPCNYSSTLQTKEAMGDELEYEASYEDEEDFYVNNVEEV